MSQSNEIPRVIRSKVAEELVNLAPHLQTWLRTHLVEPRLSKLSVDRNGSSFKHFWLVTDHNGEQDSSYRIVYDGEQEVFGLECTLDSGVGVVHGKLWILSNSVENM